mgnify:CR=1 FL=1
MKQFTIIKREDNGKDINRNGFVSVLFFHYKIIKKIHVKADI